MVGNGARTCQQQIFVKVKIFCVLIHLLGYESYNVEEKVVQWFSST